MNNSLRETHLPSGQILSLIRGDLTAETTDAIVNAANQFLQHGGGVAGAIARRGGPSIQEESDAWVQAHGPIRGGEAAWTSAGRLSCRFVIHAVGPVWGEGDDDAKLTSAVISALKTADKLKLSSISIPAISTGIFGFPKGRAAWIILESTLAYFIGNPSGLKTVRLVLFDEPSILAFEKAWDDHFGA